MIKNSSFKNMKNFSNIYNQIIFVQICKIHFLSKQIEAQNINFGQKATFQHGFAYESPLPNWTRN